MVPIIKSIYVYNLRVKRRKRKKKKDDNRITIKTHLLLQKGFFDYLFIAVFYLFFFFYKCTRVERNMPYANRVTADQTIVM